ncbi:MAG: hypothetical protein NVSMB64_05510 [Candidatus Velthaea sp.]
MARFAGDPPVVALAQGGEERADALFCKRQNRRKLNEQNGTLRAERRTCVISLGTLRRNVKSAGTLAAHRSYVRGQFGLLNDEFNWTHENARA